MYRSNILFSSLLLAASISPVCAQNKVETSTNMENTHSAATQEQSTVNASKEAKQTKANRFTVNADAAQPDNIKDPLQPLNRQIYRFNDFLDRNILRPVAVQYKEKVPEDVRLSYFSFRKNLAEPWNTVNQAAQGRFTRAAKSLGRLTVNTITTLGFADVAGHLGLPREEESLGTTLGYYGVHSGPYIVLPFFGPSTLRDGFGLIGDTFARPQQYLTDGAYWGVAAADAIDIRAQYVGPDKLLTDDKYAGMRDAYLQDKNTEIATKQGIAIEDIAFKDDVVTEEDVPAATEQDSQPSSTPQQ